MISLLTPIVLTLASAPVETTPPEPIQWFNPPEYLIEHVCENLPDIEPGQYLAWDTDCLLGQYAGGPAAMQIYSNYLDCLNDAYNKYAPKLDALLAEYHAASAAYDAASQNATSLFNSWQAAIALGNNTLAQQLEKDYTAALKKAREKLAAKEAAAQKFRDKNKESADAVLACEITYFSTVMVDPCDCIIILNF